MNIVPISYTKSQKMNLENMCPAEGAVLTLACLETKIEFIYLITKYFCIRCNWTGKSLGFIQRVEFIFVYLQFKKRDNFTRTGYSNELTW